MEIEAIASSISEVIHQPVEAKLQFGILVLSVQSKDSKICAAIIERLNEIKSDRLNVQIVGTGWNKVFKRQDGQYIENTNTAVISGAIVVGAIVLFVAYIGFSYTPQKPVPAAQPPARTFIGTGPTGYEIWQDKSCVYIKGLRKSDLQRMNTDLDGVKKILKEQSGLSCVLFE